MEILALEFPLAVEVDVNSAGRLSKWPFPKGETGVGGPVVDVTFSWAACAEWAKQPWLQLAQTDIYSISQKYWNIVRHGNQYYSPL